MSDLTLIIPTYNRPQHLARLITYYRNVGLSADVMILDSSNEEGISANRDFIASCGGQFRHLEFPSSMPVATKLFEGVEQVSTPYCAFCADDDLVFPHGVERAMSCLEAHPEYVSVDGIYLNFNQVDEELEIKIEYAGKGIDAEHPGARVFRLFQRYESLFYGVYRAVDLRHILSGVSSLPSLHYQELFQSVGTLLKGKSHRLPIFYAGRQHCEAAQPERDKWQTYYWFVDNRVEFLEHYTGYRAELLKYYKVYGQGPHLDDRDFCKAMDLAHATFFSLNCPPAYFHSVLQDLWPGDPYKEIENKDDICYSLKPTHSGRLGELLSTSYRKGLSRLQEWRAKKRLDQLDSMSRKPGGTARQCILDPELLWLADVKEFQNAYAELCSYLDAIEWLDQRLPG